MPQPKITLDPMPPTQGQKMKVKYSGTLPVTLELDWDPAGTPTSVTITAAAGESVIVPSNATSVIVTDPSGGANAVATMVNPSDPDG
jgi:ABC-type Fe3+-hydroxamate transport system substrate-binding protein